VSFISTDEEESYYSANTYIIANVIRFSNRFSNSVWGAFWPFFLQKDQNSIFLGQRDPHSAAVDLVTKIAKLRSMLIV
jgi:hypothetical protein